MNAANFYSQTNIQKTVKKISNIKEETEMKLAAMTAQLNIRLPGILNMKTPAKLLGGIALGAMLMTATAFPLGPAHADELSRPLIPAYDQQIANLLEMESQVGSRTGSAAKLSVGSLPFEHMVEEDGYGWQAKVVRSSYDQQIADLVEKVSTI